MEWMYLRLSLIYRKSNDRRHIRVVTHRDGKPKDCSDGQAAINASVSQKSVVECARGGGCCLTEQLLAFMYMRTVLHAVNQRHCLTVEK
jgi:hypothetical protein